MQPPDAFLSEAIGHINATLNGGPDAVYAFREMIMLQLGRTILDTKSFVTVQSADWRSNFVIAPPPRSLNNIALASEGSEIYTALKLNNGHFLDLQFSLFVDKSDNFLKVESSRMAYQADDTGHDQFFRFEMNRQPQTHYPFSHLHVNGNWKPGKAERPIEMEKIHFPIARPTIENLIRVLVYDFNVPSHVQPKVFEPVLRKCEQAFLRVARTTSKEPQPLPPEDQ